MSTERRVKLLEEAGTDVWVAVDEAKGQIVGKGETYSAAVAMAAEAGNSDPLVIKTPPTWAPMVL
jgi:hypothetical protein